MKVNVEQIIPNSNEIVIHIRFQDETQHIPHCIVAISIDWDPNLIMAEIEKLAIQEAYNFLEQILSIRQPSHLG